MRRASVPEHELIPLDDMDRWNASLAGVAHVHAHTWGFCHAIFRTSGAPTFLYSYNDGVNRVACVVAERNQEGYTDLYTPYGFGGFTSLGSIADFPDDWARFARLHGWITGYIALNPLLCNGDHFAEEERCVRNELFVMDLRGSADDMFRRLSINRQRQLSAKPTTNLCFDREILGDFLVRTYQDFFSRRGAGTATRFVPETIQEIV